MNCDRIARLYVVAERLVFGRALDRCRVRALPLLSAHRAALVCGDGDGRFLAALLRSGRVLQVDAIDLSQRMIALARHRVSRQRQPADRTDIDFYCADIRGFAPARSHDLIATHFFLDCFDEAEIRQVVRHIAALADRQATWLVSEFEVPARGFARLLGSIVVTALYATFAVLTGLRVRRLPDYRAALAECGFVEMSDQPALYGLLTSQVWRRGEPPTAGGT